MNKEKNVTLKNTQQEQESTLLRLDTKIKKALDQEVLKLKKVKKGSGKINASKILEKLICKLSDEDRAEILSETVTGEDRFKVALLNYQKKHKKISKSEFQDMLQYAEININDYLPEEMRRFRAAEGKQLRSA